MSLHNNDLRKPGMSFLFLNLCLLIACLNSARADTLNVGPDHAYKTPSAAIGAARDFDHILIEAAIYKDDFAIINQKHLILEGKLGSNGERPHLMALNRPKNGKAIWVINGQDITIRNLEFSGAHVIDRNGAGIRLQKGSLLLENSYFHHNEMGILTANNSAITLSILACEFDSNMQDYPLTGKLSHNIYAGLIKQLTVKDSFIHGAQYGHNVKSRAAHTLIKDNRIHDKSGVGSSYLIDIPNGGIVHIEGNDLFQGKDSKNNAMISFGAEKFRHEDHRLSVIGNTVKNHRNNAVFVRRYFQSDYAQRGNHLPEDLMPQEERWDKKGFFRKLINDIKKAIE